MTQTKIHIIHAGTMDNKGTQALLLSDIALIREIYNYEVQISVSTSDVEGVKKLAPNLTEVTEPIIDIPYQKADKFAKMVNIDRDTISYKIYALASFFFMFLQAFASFISAIFIKYNIKGIYRHKSIKRIHDSDLIISCSGENFKEGSSMLPFNITWKLSWWSMLFSRTWEILLAKYLGKKVLLFPNSIGPFKTIIGKTLGKLALNNCSIVLVRDPISFDIVKTLKLNSNEILTADTALLFNARNITTFNHNGKPTLGVNPGIYGQSLSKKEVSKYISAHVKALDYGIEKYGFSVILLPHFISGFKQDDMELCNQIANEMRNPEKVNIYHAKDVDDFKSLIDSLNMLISSKMHPAIFAASGFIPVLSIAYDHKQTGFFERLDMSQCVFKIREISDELLIEKIDYVWTNRKKLSQSLKKQIPILQNDIKNNIHNALTSYIK